MRNITYKERIRYKNKAQKALSSIKSLIDFFPEHYKELREADEIIRRFIHNRLD